MAGTEARTRQVSIPTKIAYGMGHGLISVKNMLFHFFFLFYFVNVMGVPEGLVLLATLISLFADAFTDPVMGQISDNYHHAKWGRRHRFMRLAILPMTLILALLFAPPSGLGVAGLFIWMLVFTLSVRLSLTIFEVPYKALGAEMSTHYNERTNILSIRELFNNLFNLTVFIIGFTVFLPDTPEFEDGMMNQAGYAPFVLTMAIIGMIGSVIAVYGTRHKIPDLPQQSAEAKGSWRETFSHMREAARIPHFIWISAGYGLTIILYGTGSALSLYMAVYLWEFSQQAKLVVSLTPFMSLVPAIILASALPALIDKKPATLIFGFIYFTCSLGPYVAYLMGWMAGLDDHTLLMIVAFASGIGYAGLTGVIVVSNSMMADVADTMELQTGRRQEGILFAAFSFAQKMTFAVGLAIATLALIIIDFPKQAAPSEVAQSAINGLAYTSIIVTLVFGLGGLYCFLRYGLTRKDHAAIQQQLAVQRGS